MSGESGELQSPLGLGILGGVLAYALGLGLLVTVEWIGLHPDGGLWEQISVPSEYLLVHVVTHLPFWGFQPRWELVIYTSLLIYLLVLAGYFVTGRARTDDPFRTGGSIVVGYLVCTVVASTIIIFAHDAVTSVQMIAPTLLVGLFYPAVFGGLGGLLATHYGHRA